MNIGKAPVVKMYCLAPGKARTSGPESGNIILGETNEKRPKKKLINPIWTGFYWRYMIHLE